MRFREFIVKPEELDLQEGDSFDIELDNIVLETGILEILEDGAWQQQGGSWD